MACGVCAREARPGKRLPDVRRGRDAAAGLEMMHFCLDIQLDVDMAASIILCLKCCSKLISFYKFKCLAIKSFSYLNTLKSATLASSETYTEENKVKERVEANVKVEPKAELDDHEVKSEPQVLEDLKQECEELLQLPDLTGDSDYQLLSSLGVGDHDVEATQGSTAKRKRGRPKSSGARGVCGRSRGREGVCDVCGARVRDVAEHAKRHRPAGERARLACAHCEKTFATHSSRYRHTRTKHLGIKPYCDTCQKHVIDKRAHELVVHTPERMRHGCVVCGQRFPLPSALRSHMLTHSRLRPFACTHCGDAFRTKGLMINHVRSIHNKEKSHLCQYCSKGFFKKDHLTLHIRTHTDERPLPCAECGKRFRTASCLRMHLRRHRGERNHPCGMCDSSFYDAGALKVHMVSHTKEKRYPCKYCGAKFGRSDHRGRHERTAHEHAPPAPCDPSAPITVPS